MLSNYYIQPPSHLHPPLLPICHHPLFSLCYDLITSTPNSELRYIQPPLQDLILSPPLVQPCTNTFLIFGSDPTPRYVLPFIFPLWALLHITLLVIPCPLLSDARLFLFIHIRYSWTSVQPLRTFLIHPQYLPDLDSPLFSFRTDFELYK